MCRSMRTRFSNGGHGIESGQQDTETELGSATVIDPPRSTLPYDTVATPLASEPTWTGSEDEIATAKLARSSAPASRSALELAETLRSPVPNGHVEPFT